MAAEDIGEVLNELVRRANESTRRLRALEERDSAIEYRVTSIQDAILKITEENKILNEKLSIRMQEIENSLLKILKQL